MHTQLRRMAAIAAFTIGAGAFTTLIPILAQEQEHRDSTAQRDYNRDNSTNHPDYSNNSYYRMGNQEGYQDYGQKKQRSSHNHKYKTDDDRRAHDYGYQEGWQGRNYRDGDRDRDRDRDGDRDRDANRDPH